jgi:hypothetical protein
LAGASRSGTALAAGRFAFTIQEDAMADVKTGDKVTWKSHGGTAEGTVEKKVTSPTKIKGHNVAASKDNPEFIVKTGEGKKAAHKAGALTKK